MATPERLEYQRQWKERKRREEGIPKRGEKPFCDNGHPRTPENLSGKSGDCKACARERMAAKRREQGIQPRHPGVTWTCSHDPGTNMRYVKGKPKGCKACHREKQRTRPCDAEQKRAYAQSHRDEINTRRRAWRAVNRPDAVEFINGDDLAVEYARIIDGDPCVYCGRPGIEKDHIIAVASGGTGEWINLAPICRRCNASKQDRDVLRFMLRRLVLAA